MDRVHFVHLNSNYSTKAYDGLKPLLDKGDLDVVSLNEPYVYRSDSETKTVVPGGFSAVHSGGDNFRAAVWVRRRIPYVAVPIERDVVALSLTLDGERVIVVTCFCPPEDDMKPTFELLDDLMFKFRTDKFIVVGDFNAKSSVWGPAPTDARGRVVLSLVSNDRERSG